MSPPGACASVRKPSDIGAEQNHLCPVRCQACPSGSALVALARRSEPPCFSVIAMPSVAAALPATGAGAGSWARAVSRGRHSAESAASASSAGTAAWVIVMGQQTPGSTWVIR